MKKHRLILSLALAYAVFGYSSNKVYNKSTEIQPLEISQVKINDSFWSPKFDTWRNVTINDVLDKFEGKHLHDKKEQEANDTFSNFDFVAEGKRDVGHHAGLPWFDGLVYETIRGVSDFLAQSRDEKLERRIDNYIDRIAAAQKTEPTGYIDTYTQMISNNQRWGDNGGFLRFQHDVYNSGMLVEAGIHYYKATGKTKLLEVATRLTNYMSGYMGDLPKRNIVPAHSGPEEAVIKLYWLYKDNPELKKKINVPVDENAYLALAKFWIENRGNHCGYPLWLTWGNDESEKWIKENKYLDPKFGKHTRPSWGDYAQDSTSIFNQTTIEGHAVRATLLATAITAMAIENPASKYIKTANDLWNNMVGRRMFVTGGVGAIHHDEKFGPDYFLPTDAYLETCAAVGAGFFSQRMNELTGDGKYMDEFERSLYNNVLTGISLSGDHYTYQNPLNADKHERWEWHSCPCCPPMFLKIVSSIPEFIYSQGQNSIYVNLFIGSDAKINLNKDLAVGLKQETQYPWKGNIAVTVNPEKESSFAVKMRIPGWAEHKENPYGLYTSNLKEGVKLMINGKSLTFKTVNGYAEINRKWKKGDRIELILPMQPRLIYANNQVKDLKGMTAIASGPIIYCVEEIDNSNFKDIKLDVNSPLQINYHADVLNGVNVIKGTAIDKNSNKVPLSAVPYFAAGNRQQGGGYKVWIPE